MALRDGDCSSTISGLIVAIHLVSSETNYLAVDDMNVIAAVGTDLQPFVALVLV